MIWIVLPLGEDRRPTTPDPHGGHRGNPAHYNLEKNWQKEKGEVREQSVLPVERHRVAVGIPTTWRIPIGRFLEPSIVHA